MNLERCKEERDKEEKEMGRNMRVRRRGREVDVK